MPDQSRRDVLEGITGIGIGTTALGTFGGTASATTTLPNDLWDYDLGCDSDSSCPATVESDEFLLRDDGTFTTAGSYGFKWYGSAYGDVFGWTHGIGFAGGCEVEDNDAWDGLASNLRGQRYSIHVPTPVDGEEILKGTSNHLHGVHPRPNDVGMSWAETAVRAGIEYAMGTVNFGLPMGTLVQKFEDYDGFDFSEYDVGYAFSHTGATFPVELWPRCAHSDAAIYVTDEFSTPYLEVKHGYLEHNPTIGTATWEDASYTLSAFSTSGASANGTRPDADPSSLNPNEMTAQERRRWGVKPVEGKGYTREVRGEVEEVTHVITENPFYVVGKRRSSEPADL